MDDYWVAQALLRVQAIEKLPRMLKPVDLKMMQALFLETAKKLIQPS